MILSLHIIRIAFINIQKAMFDVIRDTNTVHTIIDLFFQTLQIFLILSISTEKLCQIEIYLLLTWSLYSLFYITDY